MIVRRRMRGLVITLVVAGLLLTGLLVSCSKSPTIVSSPSPSPMVETPGTPPQRRDPPITPSPTVAPWQWVSPGIAGVPPITLTAGITQYVYYAWSPYCDHPERRGIPMIWGEKDFANSARLAGLFDGSCNDGRPLLFLNEPAKEEQANINPIEAANMFYTMTRSVDWPYRRWRGPIYAGNNLIEDQKWDAEFVRHFAELHNGGSTAIREVAGWGIHLYGNYEYGPGAGDPEVVWTDDIPKADIPGVVDRSMKLVDAYTAAREAEGNSTKLLVTEFGLLQASAWHTPPAYFYTTTAAFMDEYVKRFDRIPQVQAWFWFVSTGSASDFLDVNMMVDPMGALTPNGDKWRELALRRQTQTRLP